MARLISPVARGVWGAAVVARAGRVLALGVLVSGCATRPVSRPVVSTPVRRETPTELLPDDLDVIVRVDLARLRASPLYAFVEQAAVSSLGRSAQREAFWGSVRRARTIFFGSRLMPDGLRGDGVVVVDGADVTPSEGVVDTLFGEAPTRVTEQSGVRWVERAAAAERFEPALAAVVDDRWLAFATPAEADALRRVAERGGDRDRLVVPERGLLSFSARRPFGQSWRASPRPGAPSLLDCVEGASAVFELGDDGVAFEASLELSSEPRAREIGALLRPSQETAPAPRRGNLDLSSRWGALLALRKNLQVREQGAGLHVRGKIPLTLLDTWFSSERGAKEGQRSP